MKEPTSRPEPERLLAHAGSVRRLSLVLTRDEHDADDLAQDAMLWPRSTGRPWSARAW